MDFLLFLFSFAREGGLWGRDGEVVRGCELMT